MKHTIAAQPRSVVAVTGLFVVLTLLATYPIARAPASMAYFTHPDAQLNMWIMSWDARAVLHDPRHLFDTNIFFPHRDTLAYSETLLGYLPIFGPVLWLRGSPALAFNIVLLFSFVASGLGMYLLVVHLTGRSWPAVIAGITYAFVPYRFVHIPQVQLEATEWIPLALLCLHLFVERGVPKYAVALGACLVIEALCCVYYGVFLGLSLLLAMTVLLLCDRRARDWRRLATLALVAMITVLALAPVAGVYLRVHEKDRLVRPVSEIEEKSADAATYLASTAPLHQRLWGAAVRTPRDYLFPGVLTLILATFGVLTTWRLRRIAVPPPVGHVALYATLALFGVVASLGPGMFGDSPIYRRVYLTVVGFQALRQLSRCGIVALFGLAVLSGYGVAAAEALVPRLRARWKVAVTAAVFIELFSAPLVYDRPGGDLMTRVPPVPPEYAWLARQPGRFSITELPVAPRFQLWRNAPYVFWSTTHWQGLVNGYSGFPPSDYRLFETIIGRFPDELSRRALELRRVRYIVVHRDRSWFGVPPFNRDAVNNTTWLTLSASFPNADIYAVEPSGSGLVRDR